MKLRRQNDETPSGDFSGKASERRRSRAGAGAADLVRTRRLGRRFWVGTVDWGGALGRQRPGICWTGQLVEVLGGREPERGDGLKVQFFLWFVRSSSSGMEKSLGSMEEDEEDKRAGRVSSFDLQATRDF